MLNKANEAAQKFERAKSAIQEFLMENEELFTIYTKLAERYNDTLAEVRKQLYDVETMDGVRIGSFSRSEKKTVVKYRIDKLAPATLLAVITDVDIKKLEEMRGKGLLTAEELANARYEEVSTPRIRGPKEIELAVDI